MLRLNICAGSLILLGTILAKDQVHGELPPETGRFGFFIMEKLRQSFCNSSCMSADTNLYLTNIACAVKCPELYLPHHSTTPESTLPITATTDTVKPNISTSSTTISTTSSSTAPTLPTTSAATNSTIPPTTMTVPTTVNQTSPTTNSTIPPTTMTTTSN